MLALALKIALALIVAGVVAIAWGLTSPEGRALIEEMRGDHTPSNTSETERDHG